MQANENKKIACKVHIEGRVQGVGFRYSAMKAARRHDVYGWVRNEYDGSVTIFCEGDLERVEQFLQWCRKGPPSAHIVNVDINRLSYTGKYNSFSVAY
ncbi:MAG: acylphosphatase [bacterium]